MIVSSSLFIKNDAQRLYIGHKVSDITLFVGLFMGPKIALQTVGRLFTFEKPFVVTCVYRSVVLLLSCPINA